jgi:hypothetical protein
MLLSATEVSKISREMDQKEIEVRDKDDWELEEYIVDSNSICWNC